MIAHRVVACFLLMAGATLGAACTGSGTASLPVPGSKAPVPHSDSTKPPLRAIGVPRDVGPSFVSPLRLPGITYPVCDIRYVSGDFTGDGRTDRIWLFGRAPSSDRRCPPGMPNEVVGLQQGATGPIALAAQSLKCAPTCIIAGAADLNHDGIPEVLMGVHVFYPTSPVGLRAFTVGTTTHVDGNGKVLWEVMEPSGTPLQLKYGSGGAGAWDFNVACALHPPGTLLQLAGTSDGGSGPMRWRITTYRLAFGAAGAYATVTGHGARRSTRSQSPTSAPSCWPDLQIG